MTEFNPLNKEVLTFGEALAPAMKITDENDAKQYLEKYAKYLDKFDDKIEGKTSLEIALINLGYYAGYYNSETQERVNRLFNTKHPIFG